MAEETNTQAPALTLGQDTTQATPTTAPATRVAPPLPEGKKFIWGTGRRKKAIARVRVRPGTGKISVNDRELEGFFPSETDRRTVLSPLTTINMVSGWDVFARVNGGGIVGQAGAISLGLARALIQAMPEIESALRGQGLLTRDARMKERKKYGQKGARKRFQFSKR